MRFNLKLIGAATLVAASLGVASAADAAPAGPGAASGLGGGLVKHVAQGCGPGFFRGPRGFCRPMRGFGPRFYGPRCFVRRTPFGPRRVCR